MAAKQHWYIFQSCEGLLLGSDYWKQKPDDHQFQRKDGIFVACYYFDSWEEARDTYLRLGGTEEELANPKRVGKRRARRLAQRGQILPGKPRA